MPKLSLVVLGMLFFPLRLTAQDTTTVRQGEEIQEVRGAVEGINETLAEMKNTLDALRKIKVTGYLQTQYQIAENPGVSSFAGGNFPTNVRSRFQVRRGRLKVNYDNDLTQYVLQIDVTQNGVGIKDAYASIKEPWLRAASMTGGVFDRPFGFEIGYSSGSRESPERSRMFQTLFPGERELGAKIEVSGEEGILSNINLKAGLFNGVLSTGNENDRFKDFIGRLGFALPFEEYSLAVDGGASLYSGKATNNSKYLYSVPGDGGAKRFSVDSTASIAGAEFGRVYYGADIELYYDLPVIGGFSLRGEYITGQQPGTSTGNGFYNPDAAGATDTKSSLDGRKLTPLYVRNFHGWYVNYVQNIGVRHQFVLKYDVFDPNTDVEGNDIGAAGSNLSAADLRYTTLGVGWIYHFDANVKLVAYYDFVTNESVNAAATGSLLPLKNDIKDDVFTLRMQYRF